MIEEMIPHYKALVAEILLKLNPLATQIKIKKIYFGSSNNISVSYSNNFSEDIHTTALEIEDLLGHLFSKIK